MGTDSHLTKQTLVGGIWVGTSLSGDSRNRGWGGGGCAELVWQMRMVSGFGGEFGGVGGKIGWREGERQTKIFQVESILSCGAGTIINNNVSCASTRRCPRWT